MKRMVLGILGLVVLLAALLPQEAAAIPAFARKYKTACTTCHAPFPRLTAVGEAFRLNGYKLPEGDELAIKDQPVSMGAAPYKAMFPASVWPSDIPGIPPLSLRIIGSVTDATGGSVPSHTNFNFPDEIDLLSAGALGADFAYFANLAFTPGSGTTNVDGLAWLMWQDLFGGVIGKNHLNIKAGNVGRQSIALPNSRDENSFTVEGYLYQDQLGLTPQPGVQVNGFGANWRYYAGLVQTNQDSNKKDYYGGLAFKFGGVGFDGSGLKSEEGGLTTSPSGYWRDDSILLGLFAHRAYSGATADVADQFGADIQFNYMDVSLGGGYIREKADATDTTQDIWFVEGHAFVYPWLIPYARLEALKVKDTDDQDKTRIIAGAAFLVRANIKLNVEYRYYTVNDPMTSAGGGTHDEDQLTFLVDFSL
jgi:hypothetical protein